MWQKYWADSIKNKQYEDILNIYQQDADNKKDALKAIYGIGGNSGNTNDKTVGNDNNTSLATAIKYNNIAPGWTPSQYQPSTIAPNIPHQSVGVNTDVLNLKYGDYSINKLNAPYGKYWYINPDEVANSAKRTRNWAKSKEQYQRGAFGTPERISFSSDYTGGFGPNGLFYPKWAGSLFDYNPFSITSLRQR